MIIKKELPPNIEEIRRAGLGNEGTIYTYGDTIYNPSGEEIPEDIEFHEFIHSKQQKAYGSVENWWVKYCWDKEFRLEAEVEAYASQYAVIRKSYPVKACREALDEFASNLSSNMYQLYITKSRAESLIRHKSLMV